VTLLVAENVVALALGSMAVAYLMYFKLAVARADRHVSHPIIWRSVGGVLLGDSVTSGGWPAAAP